MAKIIELKNPIIAQKHLELAENPKNAKDYVSYWEELKLGVREL